MSSRVIVPSVSVAEPSVAAMVSAEVALYLTLLTVVTAEVVDGAAAATVVAKSTLRVLPASMATVPIQPSAKLSDCVSVKVPLEEIYSSANLEGGSVTIL